MTTYEDEELKADIEAQLRDASFASVHAISL
jgi:hypothetical protein